MALNRPALQRKVALAVHQAASTGTPVRTGRARANWLIGLRECDPPYGVGASGARRQT